MRNHPTITQLQEGDQIGYWTKHRGLLMLWSVQGYLIGWLESGPNVFWGKSQGDIDEHGVYWPRAALDAKEAMEQDGIGWAAEVKRGRVIAVRAIPEGTEIRMRLKPGLLDG